MSHFLNGLFDFSQDREEFHRIRTEIEMGVRFRGANLWVLIFAIFVASLGLNVNSTAVVIGAMLISPLMGPIIAIGLGASIYDPHLLKNALKNFGFATLVSLLTSSLYFSFTPLDEAHSELLARTSPNIYDVLIAFFGGFAGITALASKIRGNVIPGVAIATALMPPLCTAGYGIASGNITFLAGALYLYLINAVFIALATFLFSKFIHFPHVYLRNKKEQARSNRIIIALTMMTLIPSVYLGYKMIMDNRFLGNARAFIENEIRQEGHYVIEKEVDPKRKAIRVLLAGGSMDSTQERRVRTSQKKYGLEQVSLAIEQAGKNGMLGKELSLSPEMFSSLEAENIRLKKEVQAMQEKGLLRTQIARELPLLFPVIDEIFFSIDGIPPDSTIRVLIRTKAASASLFKDTPQIRNWLQERMNNSKLKLHITND